MEAFSEDKILREMDSAELNGNEPAQLETTTEPENLTTILAYLYELQTVHAEQDLLKEKVKSLEEQHKVDEAKCQGLREALRMKTTEHSESKLKIQSLESAIFDLEHSLKEHKAKDRRDMVKDLKTRAEELSQTKRLIEQNKELIKKCDRAEYEANGLRADLDNFRLEVTVYKHRLEKAQEYEKKSIIGFETRFDKLWNDFQHCQNKLQDKLDAALENSKELQAELQAAKAERDKVEVYCHERDPRIKVYDLPLPPFALELPGSAFAGMSQQKSKKRKADDAQLDSDYLKVINLKPKDDHEDRRGLD